MVDIKNTTGYRKTYRVLEKLEILQEHLVEYPMTVYEAEENIRKVPTLKKNVYKSITPMLKARFDFAGSWVTVGIITTWFSFSEMKDNWNKENIHTAIETYAQYWENSAPWKHSSENLSLLGMDMESNGDCVFLVWSSKKEPEVVAYNSQREEKYKNFFEYASHMNDLRTLEVKLLN